ncbi:hypothetical protein LOD99_5710 [Oopsacas minuta]|uniref:IQ motif and ubiquitin-like domain-containing protein n=1 Tax=Oopsacas minuta TaxID=111878 RepID=A0AAV7JR92_9METZ|nr:hypothetical protein LOD99_5710 [Oopsacas minuta]
MEPVDNDNTDTPQEIDLSERTEVIEKESSAEIELYHNTTQLSTSITIPLHNTLSYLQSKAAEIFRDGDVELLVDGELVDLEKSLKQLGIDVSEKKRVEVRYIEKEPAQEVEKEQELIEIESKPEPSEETPTEVEIQTEQAQDSEPISPSQPVAPVSTPIAIIPTSFKKPFLGGYKHKDTEIEYHHASVQTDPKKRLPRTKTVFERETQTITARNRLQQTSSNAATQMCKTGLHISEQGDRVMYPGRYETAEERGIRIESHVLILQTHFRRWRATRDVNSLRITKANRAAWLEKESERKARQRELRDKFDLDRRLNPKTKADFDLLYHALESWRLEEVGRINSTLQGPERKAALCALLEQEAELIGSIHRHKSIADKDNETARVQKFLEKAASSKSWITPDGLTIEMETPYTQRATQLKELYNSLSLQEITRDERLDVLMTLKQTVSEHDCDLTRDIVQLIDRESDLLIRGSRSSALTGLRNRLINLYLQYVKTPLFNAEAARLIKVPQDPVKLSGKVYFCKSCREYLPSVDFPLTSNARMVGHCRQCRELENRARERGDNTMFRLMLKRLRHSEDGYKDGSKLIYLMQDEDIRYIVESIWNSKSVLSGETDLYELRLVRWDNSRHFTPWNCILLSESETIAHLQVHNINESYGTKFIEIVKHKHITATHYFSRLTTFNKHLAENMSNKTGRTML